MIFIWHFSGINILTCHSKSFKVLNKVWTKSWILFSMGKLLPLNVQKVFFQNLSISAVLLFWGGGIETVGTWNCDEPTGLSLGDPRALLWRCRCAGCGAVFHTECRQKAQPCPRCVRRELHHMRPSSFWSPDDNDGPGCFHLPYQDTWDTHTHTRVTDSTSSYFVLPSVARRGPPSSSFHHFHLIPKSQLINWRPSN